MAGPRQHHIPQLLQRRFSLSTKPDQVVVYEKDGRCYRTNTGNFGAQRDFYTESGDSSVDDLITDYEGNLSSFLDRVEAGSAAALADMAKLGRLISHIELRSQYMRVELAGALSHLFRDIVEVVSSPTRFKSFLLRSIQENPALINDKLREAGVPEEFQAAARELAITHAQRVFDDFFRGWSPPTIQQIRDLESEFPRMVKAAHLAAYREHDKIRSRDRQFASLNFSVRTVADGIILPDTMIAVCMGAIVRPFGATLRDVSEVLLPLSATRYLHGYSYKSPPERNARTINRMLASVSLSRFAAGQERDDYRGLAGRIGTNVGLIHPREITRLVASHFGVPLQTSGI